MCQVLPQWIGYVEAAYVQDYREVDPERVADTPGILNLEGDAARKGQLLSNMQTACN